MKLIFADTGYWIALISSRDALRAKARSVSSGLGTACKMVTTELVAAAVLNSLAGSGMLIRQGAATTVGRMMSNPDIEVVPQTPDLFRRALALYRDRPDKDWSLTDCASFLIMDERRITDALTHDHHFEQRGCRALLRA